MIDAPLDPPSAQAKSAPAKGSTFLSDIFVRVLAQGFSGLRGLIYIPIIAKQLGAENFGIWAQVLALAVLFVPICTFRLETASVLYLPGEQDRQKIGRMIGTILLFQIGVVCSVMILGVSFRNWLVEPLFGETASPVYVILLLLLVSVKVFSYFLLYIFRVFKKVKLYSILEVTGDVFQMIAVVVAVLVLHMGLQVTLSIFIATEVFLALAGLYFLRPLVPIRLAWEWTELKRYLRYGIPLMPNNVFAWITKLSDRLVITWYLGVAAAGIYATSYMLGGMVSFLHNPIGFVLFPSIAKAWANKNEEAVRKYITASLALYLIFCVPAVALITLTGPYLLHILAAKEFITDRLLIGSVSVGLATVGIYKIVQYVVYLNERTELLTAMYAAIAAGNLLGNIILVPRIGILGPALTTLLSFAAQMVVIMVLAKRVSKVKLVIWPPVWKYFAAIAPTSVFLLFPPPTSLLQCAGMVISSLGLYAVLLFLLGAVGPAEYSLILSTLPRLRRLRPQRATNPQKS